jgi:SAM-dependent methyltransferase
VIGIIEHLDFREQLSSLPRLSNRVDDSTPCKICQHSATAFDVVDFNKICHPRLYPFGFVNIPVIYYRCEACSFIFTKFFDQWTANDFSKYIYNDDYIFVDPEYTGERARRMAAVVAGLFRGCEDARILDYGSGTGAFAESMRPLGYNDIASYDPFSAPELPTGGFDIITCLEVIEHTVWPLASFEEMLGLLAPGGAVIVSTGLQPFNITEIRGNWWYIAPRNGHISIFAANTCAQIANRLGLALRLGEGMYGFAQPSLQSAVKVAIERIGPVFRGEVRLGAPIEGDPLWNGYETDAGIGFRWTRLPEVTWPLHSFEEGTTKIQIPFLMEIVPGFAQNSQVFLGAEPLPTEVTRDVITATVRLLKNTTEAIRLVTPPLHVPQEWGSPDTRSLGLAIRILDGVPR